MEYKKRKELVGKRFLCVKNINKPKLSRICDWGWRSGVIRAVNRTDSAHPSLKVNFLSFPLIFRWGFGVHCVDRLFLYPGKLFTGA
jgi:hypothetical protein